MTNETKELKTYTMQELYEHPLEPMACLVDGLLAPGLYILGGSPKVGKSWMALQLCLAVCGGKAFLGRATRKARCSTWRWRIAHSGCTAGLCGWRIPRHSAAKNAPFHATAWNGAMHYGSGQAVLFQPDHQGDRKSVV